MKKFLLISLLLLGVISFGQTRQEKLIDSVLVEKTGKTYQEYLAHYQKVDYEYEIQKNRTFVEYYLRQKEKDSTFHLPLIIPNKQYSTEEFPIMFISQKSKYFLLNEIPKASFNKIKNVHFVTRPASPKDDGIFGISIIEGKTGTDSIPDDAKEKNSTFIIIIVE